MADAAHALARFGYGAGPGDLRRVAGDPRGWAIEQLGRKPAAVKAPDAEKRLRAYMRARAKTDDAMKKAAKRDARRNVQSFIAGKIQRAASGDRAPVERWVDFWANHFTVAIKSPFLAAAAPSFEADALRPNAFRSFRDLLGAVARHQAMLLYLDQAQSIGPNTPAARRGKRRNRGLNENFARELLELHTLGVDGGYGQADVLALAQMLTGWSIQTAREKKPGAFIFRNNAHEPGAKTLLGRRIPEGGRDEGERALDLLAAHPSTARNIARALARHYVADDPPADAVDRLARRFRQTDGDLREMALAVAGLDAAWATPFSKARRPFDYIVGVMRALEVERPMRNLAGALRTMGQPPLRAPSPKGWPDTAEDWLSPQGVMRRIEIAELAARRRKRAEPLDVLDLALGDAAHPATRFHVANAGDRVEGVAVALASPEMMRR